MFNYKIYNIYVEHPFSNPKQQKKGFQILYKEQNWANKHKHPYRKFQYSVISIQNYVTLFFWAYHKSGMWHIRSISICR